MEPYGSTNYQAVSQQKRITMRFSGVKLRVMTKNATQWNNAVRKAINEGAFSRDGQLAFMPDKPAMVIDNGAIKNSRPDFQPEKAPYDTELTYGQWMNSGSKFRDVTTSEDDGCEEAIVGAMMGGFSAGLQAAKPPKGLMDYLVPSEVQTMDQNNIIWKTKGLPFLISKGVELTEDNGTYYVVDTKANIANEVTPQWAITKGVVDMQEGKTSAFTAFLHEFQLVSQVTLKVKPEDNQ